MPGTSSGPNTQPQLVDANAGLRTQFGMVLPPGANVAAFVCNASVSWADHPYIATNLVSTLDAGLKRCRTGFSDYVVVLPGHSESVADATMLANLKAGTRVVGVGHGSVQPTFRWTATTSQWAISVADVLFAGLFLKLEGANGVVKAIVSTAANTMFSFNRIQVASGATAKATIALELGAGATDFAILSNQFFGTPTHNVTDGVKVVSAVAGGRIEDNEMIFSATAANGNVHYTAAATRQVVARNLLYNTHTASSVALCVDDVAMDGIVSDNRCACISTGAATSGTVGIKLGASVLAAFFENYVVNDPLASGVLKPTVDT